MVNAITGLVPNGPWKERWVLSYIFDYFIIVFFILGFSALDLSEPHHQRFSLRNESLQYPFADPERITAAWAAVINCLFPMLFIIFWCMLIDGRFSHHKPNVNRSRIMGKPWTITDRLWEVNCGILGLGLSVAGAICITGVLKNVTGKPRPDIIARCQPKAGSKNMEPYGLVDPDQICTQTDHRIYKDGFRSWPSGHASTAFAGLGYLSLFVAGKLHIMDNRGEVWKTLIVLVPLMAAALVAVSRIMDARHHPFDVLSGSLLGQVVAWVAYRQYFPSLTKPTLKGRAYPRRSWGTEDRVSDDAQYSTARSLEEGRHSSSESLTSEGQFSSRKRVGPTAYGPTSVFADPDIPLQERQTGQQIPSHGIAFEQKISPSHPPLKSWNSETSADTVDALATGHRHKSSVDNTERSHRAERATAPSISSDNMDDVKLV